jgi:hypothetical protein
MTSRTAEPEVYRLPEAVVLPRDNSKKLLNIDPVVITRADLTSDYAWYKLAVEHSPTLQQIDFKDKDLYTKYYLLTLGLLDFPVIAVGGEPEAGKSLLMAWLTERLHRLFKKRACLDWAPPEPKYFGNYHDFKDHDFQLKLVDDFDFMHRLEQDTGRPVPLEIRRKLIVFNAIMGLDEADSYCHKKHQTNTTKVIGETGRRRRHVFAGIILVMINPEDFADDILQLITHKVTCYGKEHMPYPECCEILIEDIRPGGTGLAKSLWLDPSKYLHLWDSHNIPAMSHRSIVSFAKRTKKEEAEHEEQYRRFVEINLEYFDDSSRDRLLKAIARRPDNG